jgi:O-antigen/teichoic acid export membrane protein
MTDGSSRFLGNALFNLLGGALPALVTIFTIPFVVGQLGDGAYGVLMLITSIVGYFALLDINVTAGAVKFVSEHHATGDQERVHQTITFGLWVYLGIGVAGMLGVWATAGMLVQHLFSIPQALQADSLTALRWAALGFLLGQLQAYLQSVPQALHRYDVSGRIEAFFGVLVPVLTVALLAGGYGLVEVVVLRVVTSAAHCIGLAWAIKRLLPDFKLATPSRDVRRGILSFSAFSFLSRVAAISYTHADKLLIGGLVGVQQVTYFAVASTLVNRVMTLTGRLSGVIFPVASALAANRDMHRLEQIYLQTTRYLFFINGAAVLLMACLAGPILHFWMGPKFAELGTLIMVVVALSQLIDSITVLPSLVNDGLGHPRVTGLFAVTRALVGLAMLYVGIVWAGAEGAAWAHLWASAMMTVVFVVYVHGRTVPVLLSQVLRHAYGAPSLVLVVGAILAMSLSGAAQSGLVHLLGVVLLIVVALLAAGWCWVVPSEHRLVLVHRLRQLFV